METFMGFSWSYVVWFVCVVMITISLVSQFITRCRHPVSIPAKEKIAYSMRLLTNLTPIALILITDAEIQFGVGAGRFKRSWVIDRLYERIPDEYKKYITIENLDAIINVALPQAESLWADNPKFLDPFIMGSRIKN